MSKENIEIKAKEVDEIIEKVKKSKSIVLVDYRGLSVSNDVLMRNELKKANVEYKVLKNRLVLRALNACGFEGFDKILEGPTAVAFGYDDAVAPAKILVDSCAKYNKMKVKGGLIENKKASAEEVAAFSKIPGKPVLVSQLLGMLTNPVRSLAVAISEIAKKTGM